VAGYPPVAPEFAGAKTGTTPDGGPAVEIPERRSQTSVLGRHGETKTRRRNLVLARVGAASLHRWWLDSDQPRSWDLRLVPYEVIPPQGGLDCVVGDVVPGAKWAGIRHALRTWDGWRHYERVWIPDDDLCTEQHVINRMFEIAEAVGLDLFAPALDESSYYAHFSTMRNRSFTGRWVGFVEIMAPGFHTEALARVLPTLDLTDTGWGWGLDSVWPKLLGYRNVGVIDATAVTHTRPVGCTRDTDLHRRNLDESDRLQARYDCKQFHATFGAFGPDLRPLDLTAEQLLVDEVAGWRYLIERDPRVLTWIVDFHRQRFALPRYPTEGTPSSGLPTRRPADRRRFTDVADRGTDRPVASAAGRRARHP
jgi:Protein of unknown function (DUF707)